jgi:hypothetical protein
VQLHFTTRVRYGFLSVQLNYTIRHYFPSILFYPILNKAAINFIFCFQIIDYK